MVVLATSGLALFALGALITAVPGVGAQGISTIQCMPSYAWANNSIQQNPCLVTAYLQAQCAEGTFTMNPLPVGYHYVGPTNDTSTQNPCICSTPVYMLESACGACQNRTFVSWSTWSLNCPAAITAEQGQYTQIIPTGTLVPHWAFLKPSDYNDFFDPNAAKLVGDAPESSQVLSSQTSTSTSSTASSTTPASTTVADITSGTNSQTVTSASPTTTQSNGGGGGGGGGSSNTGAIAGGVVGGVLGLALIALLGFLLHRHFNKNNNNGATVASGSGDSLAPQMAGAGAGEALVGQQPQGYVQQQPTGPTVGSGGGSTGYYNPSDNFPQAQPYTPQPTGGYVPQPQPGQGGYYPAQPQGRYSGMPEV